MPEKILFKVEIRAEARVDHHAPCVPWCPVCYPICNTCGIAHPNSDHDSQPAIAEVTSIGASFILGEE